MKSFSIILPHLERRGHPNFFAIVMVILRGVFAEKIRRIEDYVFGEKQLKACGSYCFLYKMVVLKSVKSLILPQPVVKLPTLLSPSCPMFLAMFLNF